MREGNDSSVNFWRFNFREWGALTRSSNRQGRERLRRRRRKTIKRELARLAKQLTVVKFTGSLVSTRASNIV